MNPVICIAIESEFVSSHEIRFPIIYTGIGKINATYTLTRYLSQNPFIDTVINIGSAGGIRTEDKYKVIEFGVFSDGEMNYPSYEQENIITFRSAAKICTFDCFQTSLPDQICDAVDMESFALAKVSENLAKKFYCFKYITDIVGTSGQESEWIAEHSNGREKLKDRLYQEFQWNNN
jgi:adenosylhomocysteine nucleosidase